MNADAPEPDPFKAIEWRDDRLVLLDQRRLPGEEAYIELDAAGAVADAIRHMVVRGAPAIGITAAYGVALAARARRASGGLDRAGLEADLDGLILARPTAVNLAWAVERMRRVIAVTPDDGLDRALLDEARSIHAADIAANHRIGELGAGLIDEPGSVLTHCNAGALATGGYGTALGVIRSAFEAGRIDRVYAGETRPWLQGARLTAWEMVKAEIPVSLIPDGAAAWLMRQGVIRWVIVGADRITANGDVVNKIGTYSLAVNARHHGVRFMVAAPNSTIDPDLPSGDDVPIEFRDAGELLGFSGRAVAAPGAEAWNPVFDMTPAALVDVIVTETGVVENPAGKGVLGLLPL
ncbi:MAG: S-methyl-5-thioribose-1-phosphate isomerase [Gammaproteobacteria bacterium]|nr:S-methyl-5-thioribose-1-phosphate isomerase [Gammaproteobacteria bacterium]